MTYKYEGELIRMIQANIEVDKCKQEWERRFSLPYPYRHCLMGYINCETAEIVKELKA